MEAEITNMCSSSWPSYWSCGSSLKRFAGSNWNRKASLQNHAYLDLYYVIRSWGFLIMLTQKSDIYQDTAAFALEVLRCQGGRQCPAVLHRWRGRVANWILSILSGPWTARHSRSRSKFFHHFHHCSLMHFPPQGATIHLGASSPSLQF